MSQNKTNVHRKKTMKWVQAKVQNYDGDEWGNDFEEEEEGDHKNTETTTHLPHAPAPAPLLQLPQTQLSPTLSTSLLSPLSPLCLDHTPHSPVRDALSLRPSKTLRQTSLSVDGILTVGVSPASCLPTRSGKTPNPNPESVVAISYPTTPGKAADQICATAQSLRAENSVMGSLLTSSNHGARPTIQPIRPDYDESDEEQAGLAPRKLSGEDRLSIRTRQGSTNPCNQPHLPSASNLLPAARRDSGQKAGRSLPSVKALYSSSNETLMGHSGLGEPASVGIDATQETHGRNASNKVAPRSTSPLQPGLARPSVVVDLLETPRLSSPVRSSPPRVEVDPSLIDSLLSPYSLTLSVPKEITNVAHDESRQQLSSYAQDSTTSCLPQLHKIKETQAMAGAETSVLHETPVTNSPLDMPPPRANSFSRPHMPGGWISETTIFAPSVVDSIDSVESTRAPIDGHASSTEVPLLNSKDCLVNSGSAASPAAAAPPPTMHSLASPATSSEFLGCSRYHTSGQNRSTNPNSHVRHALEELATSCAPANSQEPSPKDSDHLQEEIMKSLNLSRSSEKGGTPLNYMDTESGLGGEGAYLHRLYDHWMSTPLSLAAPDYAKRLVELPLLAKGDQASTLDGAAGERLDEVKVPREASGPDGNSCPERVPALGITTASSKKPIPTAPRLGQDADENPLVPGSTAELPLQSLVSDPEVSQISISAPNESSIMDQPPSPKSRPSSKRDKNESSIPADINKVGMEVQQDDSQPLPVTPKKLSTDELRSSPSTSPIRSPFTQARSTSAASQTLERSSGSAPQLPQAVDADYEAHVTPLRDILAMESWSQRMVMYRETQGIYTNINTSLDDWMGAMLSLAEHAGASRHDAWQATHSSSTESAVSSHAAAAATSHPGQSTLPSHVSHPFGYVGNDLRHSSSQVGTKGKELLMTAGKASRGLLSKGKSKLRSTREKSFF